MLAGKTPIVSGTGRKPKRCVTLMNSRLAMLHEHEQSLFFSIFPFSTFFSFFYFLLFFFFFSLFSPFSVLVSLFSFIFPSFLFVLFLYFFPPFFSFFFLSFVLSLFFFSFSLFSFVRCENEEKGGSTCDPKKSRPRRNLKAKGIENNQRSIWTTCPTFHHGSSPKKRTKTGQIQVRWRSTKSRRTDISSLRISLGPQSCQTVTAWQTSPKTLGESCALGGQGSSASQAGSSGILGYRARYAVSVQTRERMSDTPRLSSRRPETMELARVRAQPLGGMPLSCRRTVCLACGASRRCVPYRTHESPSNQLIASTSGNRREESRSSWRDFSMFGTHRQILQHTAPSPSSCGRSAVKIHRSLVNWENHLTSRVSCRMMRR